MTLAASSEHLHHRGLALHEATISKAPQTGISLRPPMHQASAAKRASFGCRAPRCDWSWRRLWGARLVARCAGEAFSSPGASHGAPSQLARERAKPQSLNEHSPRDERFLQFSLLAHVAAPLLASLRELAVLAGPWQAIASG